ncbi:hypothetical protein BDW59DRAFT_161804 [Aspergillus cavernicola]|uniref:Uncharacterized protein n=1 Tax=Aspergillus cavernicola TaxID=176166 RepID=A0ABR4IEJ6_9EURO
MSISGWAAYSASIQDDCSSAALNARQFSAPPPTYLSRALYIPRHDSSTSRVRRQFPVYRRYRAEEEGTFSDVLAYAVDFTTTAAAGGGDIRVMGSVQRHSFPSTSSAGSTEVVDVAIVSAIDDADAAVLTSRTGDIHPLQDGRMRYTLVQIGSPHRSFAADQPNPLDIVAIYHHIGVGAALSLPYSEGVLLVSPGMNPKLEAMVVGSALGMLWRLRELRGERQVSWRASRYSRKVHFGSAKSLLGWKK